MPEWNRLTRDQAHRVLNILGNHRDAIVFSKEATEVSWRMMPFYSNYRLYRLINYATLPTFTMMYLSNEHEFIPVDGTANPIYAINEKDPIKLSESNVVEYLNFFFSNVQGSEGDIFLIKDPRKMPFIETLSEAQKQSLFNSFQTLKVSKQADPLAYRVVATLYYGGALISATIMVHPDGKLSFDNQNLLLTGIHFPESLYGQPRSMEE